MLPEDLLLIPTVDQSLPELLAALSLGGDGWGSDPAAVGGGESRKQALSRVIHPNGKRGGIWGNWKPPKQGKGERCPSIFS